MILKWIEQPQYTHSQIIKDLTQSISKKKCIAHHQFTTDPQGKSDITQSFFFWQF